VHTFLTHLQFSAFPFRLTSQARAKRLPQPQGRFLPIFQYEIRCLKVGQGDGFIFFAVGELWQLQRFERLFCFGVRFQVEGVIKDDADRQAIEVEGVTAEHAPDGDVAGEFKDFVEVFGEFAHDLT
jgi:hypothetical protein